jgi:hypothetical protein
MSQPLPLRVRSSTTRVPIPSMNIFVPKGTWRGPAMVRPALGMVPLAVRLRLAHLPQQTEQGQ